MKTVKNDSHLNLPSTHPKHVGLHTSDSFATASLNGPCYAKLLLTNSLVGSIIGKNGTVISSIESESHCNLRLSNTDVYFPNTMQRICVISGELEDVKTAFKLILNKIKENNGAFNSSKEDSSRHLIENSNENTNNVSQNSNSANNQSNNLVDRFTINLVVPKTSVSIIIGKQGEAIKTLAHNTNSKLVVSDKTNKLSERMVAISGTYQSLISAGSSIIETIQTDPNLKSFCLHFDYRPASSASYTMLNNQKVQYKPYAFNNHNEDHSKYPGVSSNVMSFQCEINFQIPDHTIGAIIGKNGSTVSEIIRKTGAKITFSQKGELAPGTNHRYVKLNGPLSSVQHAHAVLIQQYVNSENQDFLSNSKPYSGSKNFSSKTLLYPGTNYNY